MPENDIVGALRELRDRQAITETLINYCHHVDRNDPVALSTEVFAEDGCFELGAKYAVIGRENLRRMFLAMASDIRVVLVKLADRLHNLRTLGYMPPDKQQQKAQETLDIFAPLANRLGIWQLKWELEDLSFRFTDPASYKRVAKMLEERRVERPERTVVLRGADPLEQVARGEEVPLRRRA